MYLRGDQVEAFQADGVKRFVERMAAHVRRAFPQEIKTSSDADLREHLLHSIAEAGRYGIELERDVADFVDLTFLLGRDFHVQVPWVGPILESPEFSADDRLRRIRYFAARQRLARAKQQSPAAATTPQGEATP